MPRKGCSPTARRFSLQRVQAVFHEVVVGATDAPRRALREALGRLLYLTHLEVVLWWMLDRSPRQRATQALVTSIRQMMPSASMALRLPPVRGFVESAAALIQDGLVGTD